MSRRYANNHLRKYFRLGTKTNTLRIEKGPSFFHEFTKAYIFARLVYYGGHIVVCNGRLKSGKCPDLVIIDTPEPIGYEITNTETKEMTINKKYPFEVHRVKQLNFGGLFDDLNEM